MEEGGKIELGVLGFWKGGEGVLMEQHGMKLKAVKVAVFLLGEIRGRGDFGWVGFR